ncbi:MAG: transglutaminase-like domain-containing protein [Thermodesulfobacteriota bacterium]|nr:MAG: transglutaminase-like domain-containing protein [Thermodesulfobacteriota bacterium]
MNKGRLIQFLILFFCLVMVVLLIQKNYLKPIDDHLSYATGVDALEKHEEWLGIYLKGEKVGYSTTKTRRAGDCFEFFEDSLMVLNMLGTKQRIESKIKSVVNQDYSLRLFDFSLLSDRITFSLHGVVNGTTLDLIMVSEKNKTQLFFPIKDVPFLSNTLKPYILKKGLVKGKRFILPFFDPSTLSFRDITIEVLGKEKILFSGQEIIVFKLKESFEGIETLAFVSEAGEVLKEEGLLGLTLIKETQEQALSGEWMKKEKPDFAFANAVPVNVSIKNARSVKVLEVRITNLPLDGFDLNEGRQSRQSNILKVRQEEPGSWETFSLPYRDGDLKKYLQPTPLIQSTDERIITQAKNIARDNGDAETTARKLLQWVFSTIKKKPTLSIPNALEVLALKVGDCNEHTALFTALSRSLGIPTRICVGLVYLKDKFYYHSWPEIYLGRWVAIDPTFNQFPADAAHIRLVIGELSDQIKILSVVNKIKLEVLEYS